MLSEVFQLSLMITSFIFMMMLLIEYVNVLTKGSWQYRLSENYWGQYIFAALMGLIPGCLGAFTIVSLYSHRIVTIGALVTTMIATSGDEAFVMLAMVPHKFLMISAILLVVSLAAGWLTDVIFKGKRTQKIASCDGFELHDKEECACFSQGEIIPQLKACSLARGTLCTLLVIIILFIILGLIGPPQWNWIRVSLLLVSTIGLFIVATVPEHFLDEHLWKHVAKRGVPKIFLWTFGALFLLALLSRYLDIETWIQESRLLVILIACLIGIIPESGPHLVFVTMYAQGILPLSVLLASSIVQDGHGMLPMLAHSRRGFVVVKAINFIIGLIVGLFGYLSGW